MATRSTIAIKREDGTISSITCNWDGYPSHNGRILSTHYKDTEKLEKLLKLGNIRALGSHPECTEMYEDEAGEARHFQSVEKYEDRCCSDYNYLFDSDKGEWLVSIYNRKDYRPLAEVLKKEENN